jgi:prepilin peptidase CpaA
MLSPTSTLILPSLILLAGAVSDLKSGKIPNWLSVGLFLLAGVYGLTTGGVSGLKEGGLGALGAILTLLPLVLFRIVGAGDLKIFVAFGMASTWSVVIYVAVAGLLLGTLLGLFRVILQGKIKPFLKNTLQIISKTKNEGELHSFPFAVALFLGWVSYLLQYHVGGAL